MLFMRQAQKSLLRTRLRAFAVTALMAMGVAVATDRVGTAEESAAYTIEVSDVTAKVGEHAVVHATLRTATASFSPTRIA